MTSKEETFTTKDSVSCPYCGEPFKAEYHATSRTRRAWLYCPFCWRQFRIDLEREARHGTVAPDAAGSRGNAAKQPDPKDRVRYNKVPTIDRGISTFSRSEIGLMMKFSDRFQIIGYLLLVPGILLFVGLALALVIMSVPTSYLQPWSAAGWIYVIFVSCSLVFLNLFAPTYRSILVGELQRYESRNSFKLLTEGALTRSEREVRPVSDPDETKNDLDLGPRYADRPRPEARRPALRGVPEDAPDRRFRIGGTPLENYFRVPIALLSACTVVISTLLVLTVPFGAGQPQELAAGDGPLRHADLDGDGDPDIVSAGGIFFINTAGSFERARNMGDRVWSDRFLAGDIDGDGQDEIVGHDLGNSTHLPAQRRWDYAGGGYFTSAPLPDEENGTVVAIFDLDRDGRQEVFTQRELPAQGLFSDIDSDGDYDFVWSLRGLSFSENVGGGCFTTRAGDKNSDFILCTVANLNGDRRPDLVGVDAGGDSVVALFNRGNWTFSRTEIPSHDATWALAGDLDSDGDRDIVAADLNGFQVRLLLNDGKGAFASGPTYNVGGLPYGTDRALLFYADADGRLDIALLTGNREDSRLVVMHGDGRGRFWALGTTGDLLLLAYMTTITPVPLAVIARMVYLGGVKNPVRNAVALPAKPTTPD